MNSWDEHLVRILSTALCHTRDDYHSRGFLFSPSVSPHATAGTVVLESRSSHRINSDIVLYLLF